MKTNPLRNQFRDRLMDEITGIATKQPANKIQAQKHGPYSQAGHSLPPQEQVRDKILEQAWGATSHVSQRNLKTHRVD